jgi:hypothetical protein
MCCVDQVVDQLLIQEVDHHHCFSSFQFSSARSERVINEKEGASFQFHPQRRISDYIKSKKYTNHLHTRTVYTKKECTNGVSDDPESRNSEPITSNLSELPETSFSNNTLNIRTAYIIRTVPPARYVHRRAKQLRQSRYS